MNILFTVAALNGFHGSVIHVKEWAEYMVSKGHSVSIISCAITPPILNIFNSQKINVYNIEDHTIPNKWDILFAYHFPLLGYLIKKDFKFKRVIVGCLSGIEALESPPLLR